MKTIHDMTPEELAARRQRHIKRVNAWRKKNPEKVKEGARKWYVKNRAKVRALAASPEVREKNRQYARAHYLANKEKVRARTNARYHSNKRAISLQALARKKKRKAVDENYKLREYIRSRMSSAVRSAGARRCASTALLVGCSIEFLKEYLAARFKKGMTWQNYGEWHIDHRIPCARFDLTDPEQQRQCFHYSNLQPLWRLENIRKNDSMPPTHQAELI